jgi:predicted phosphodiesterase
LGSTEDPSLYNLIEEQMTTVFLSDVCCGNKDSNHAGLLAYLQARQKDIDKIVVVGNLLNIQDSLGEALSIASPLLNFLKDNYIGKFHYILGQNDWQLLPLKSIFPFIHKSLQFPIGDKKAIALHGHILDTAFGGIKYDYETTLVNIFQGKYDYVITGYTGKPGITDLGGLVYLNTGDSIKNNTVLVAHRDRFFLFDYEQRKTLAIHKVI